MQTDSLHREILELLQGEGKEVLIQEWAGSLQPYDLSEILNRLEHGQQLQLVSKIPESLVAETLEYLDPEQQYRILHHLDEGITARLLRQIPSDAVVDMLLAIHPLQSARLLDLLPRDYREKIDTLMTFPEDTAGSLATVDYISAREGWTVEEALQHIRKVGGEAEIISYVYVVNKRGELVQVVSLKEIILADPGTRLWELIAGDVIFVWADTPSEEAAKILSRYDFVALPVVDRHHRMIGMVTVDDLMDVIREEATEDMQKLGGSQPLSEPYFKTTVWSLFRKRIGWLLLLFIAEAYTGTVLRHYEETLSEVIALAFFIPLLIGTGGNTGSQTVSTLVRALAVGEVEFNDLIRVLQRELFAGLLLGLSLGGVAYLRALMLGVEFQLGLVVALSGFFIVIWASMVAAVLPLILHRLKVDPAVVSGPLITTLVDGTGLFIYFTIARLILHLS
ncbi:magnesium transporter [Kroppenstedtia sanguinis]|uniref:Magnesium transporter MgtE n=1 Tax=Kroppenstedtia sanguinis TaxID=1380684 RepID=A0ABW4C847_9BACL